MTRPWYGQDIRDIITTHDKLLAYARQLEARLAEIVSIIAYQQQDLAEARALAKSRGEEVEKWKDDAMSANECLNMVADKLAQFGCEHGHGPEDTAPMFYPEWIDCVVRCAVQKARELLSSDLASSRAECERLAQLLKDQTACLKEEQDTSERLRGELAAAAAKLSPTDACDFQTAVKRVLSQVSELRSRIDNFHDALDDAGVPELDNNIYERTRWLSYQLAEARKRGEWQPIASAPKDGTQILGYFANGEQHVVGVWTQEASLGSVVECARELDGAKWTMPTHWLPLPPAPQGQPAPAEPPVENRVPSAGSPGDWVASLTKELREEIGEWMDGRVPEYRIEQLIRRHAPKPEREGGAR